jgi:hypothetical protein
MKHYKELVIPESKSNVIDYIECDMCGKKGSDLHYRDGVRWNDPIESCEVSTVINIQTVIDGPYGGGESRTIDLHICDECMENKLFEYLKSEGVTIPKPIKVDW